MFSPSLQKQAKKLLAKSRAKSLMIATAESCTGGLISALLTEIAGSSDVFERGFVTYSNEAKNQLLGVPMQLIEKWGAVSAQTALAMATGALENSNANLSISVTGIAGPGGGSFKKPVGLVHLAALGPKGLHKEKTCQFGEIGRSNIREKTVLTALQLLDELLESP